jgi:hypothetical protein
MSIKYKKQAPKHTKVGTRTFCKLEHVCLIDVVNDSVAGFGFRRSKLLTTDADPDPNSKHRF